MSVSPLPAIMIYWQSVLHFDVRLLPLPLCSHFTHASHHLYHHFLLPLSSQLFFFSTFSLFSLISFTCSPLTVLSFIMYSLSLSFFFLSLSDIQTYRQTYRQKMRGGKVFNNFSSSSFIYIFLASFRGGWQVINLAIVSSCCVRAPSASSLFLGPVWGPSGQCSEAGWAAGGRETRRGRGGWGKVRGKGEVEE